MLLPGFSTSIFGLLQGKKDDISLGLSLYSNTFLQEKIPTSAFLSLAVLLGVFAMLIPIAAFGYFLLFEQVEILLDSSAPIIERTAVLAGALLAILSLSLIHI